MSYLCSLGQIKQVQDEERKQLTQLRDVLKSSLQVEQKEVTHTLIKPPLNVSDVCSPLKT